MKALKILLMVALAAGLCTAVACGGSKAKPAPMTAVEKPVPAPEATQAPVYPSCETDAHCAAKGTVCEAGTCVQCREDAQCKSLGACGRCQANACVKEAGCCGSDADCDKGRCRGGKCN